MKPDEQQPESPDTDDVNELIHKQPFGILLREAREQKNYTILDVAEALRLTEDNIRALENSQIDELPGRAFTLGYIRSYSRFLDIDTQIIIDTYTEFYDQDESTLSSTKENTSIAPSSNLSLRLVSMLLIVILAMIVFWMQTTDEAIHDDVSASAETASLADGVENKAPDVAAPDKVKPLSKQTENKQAAEKKQNDTALNKARKKAESTSPATAGTNQDILQIHVNEESWAEIKDANGKGKRLFYDTLKTGENYQFEGQAPFKIFLGNAPAVKLSVNHQEVDLKGHIQSNNVAHLLIDETASVE